MNLPLNENDQLIVPKGLSDLEEVISDGDYTLMWTAVYDELKRRSVPGENYHVPESGQEHILLCLLHHFGLTEYGCSIRGSWLTEKGREVLAFLEHFGRDWQDKKTPEFCSAEDTWLNP